MKALRFSAVTLACIAAFLTVWAPLPARAAGLVYEKNCDSSMRTSVADAFSRMLPAVKKGIKAIDSNPASTAVVTWFGRSRDQGHIATVRDNLQQMQNRLESRTAFTIECSPSRCDDGEYARTTHGIDYLAACALFFQRPLTGTNSRAGVLLHELSHHAAGTDDIAYGQTKAQNLARGDVPSAINNADNYEYFLEPFL